MSLYSHREYLMELSKTKPLTFWQLHKLIALKHYVGFLVSMMLLVLSTVVYFLINTPELIKLAVGTSIGQKMADPDGDGKAG